MNDHERAIEAMRTATALVAAERRGDQAAMVRLWNETALQDDEGTARLVQAMAQLPSIVAEQLAIAVNVTVDFDAYFDHVLLALAADSN